MKTITFSLPGCPIPWSRVKIGQFGQAYVPERTREFKQSLAYHAQQAMDGSELLEGNLKLWAEYYFQIPSRWTKKKKAQAEAGELDYLIVGDLDNLTKSVGDALNGVVYADDRQIVSANIRKRFGKYPETIVRVEEV